MTQSAYESLVLERREGVAHLTFNRPLQRNALTHAMMRELEAALSALAADEAVRVVLLRGAGGNFCAGGDLNAMGAMPPPAPGERDPLYAPHRQYGDALARLNSLPQPVVAVVEGAAVGGGLGMACCADVVIVHEAAKLGMPEPRWGFIPSQIIPFVVRRIGEGPARYLAMMTETFGGRRALELGIAQFCCASEQEIDATLARVLTSLRKGAPHALSAAKRLVLSVAGANDQAVLDDAAATLVGLLRQDEAAAGIAAFLAKRRPPWAE